jgi:hypothetical protein
MMTERSLTRSEARADALEQIKRGQFIVAESQELLRRIDEMIAKEGLAPFKFDAQHVEAGALSQTPASISIFRTYQYGRGIVSRIYSPLVVREHSLAPTPRILGIGASAASGSSLFDREMIPPTEAAHYLAITLGRRLRPLAVRASARSASLS